MPNMEYCRYQNTLSDLRDCSDDLNGRMNLDGDDLSPEERAAAKRLIKLCREIGQDWDEDL